MVWEAIFLLALLKIPVIYVSLVVWWAIRAEPRPDDGLEAAILPSPGSSDDRPGARLRTSRRPGRGPRRSPPRTTPRRAAHARTRVRS